MKAVVLRWKRCGLQAAASSTPSALYLQHAFAWVAWVLVTQQDLMTCTLKQQSQSYTLLIEGLGFIPDGLKQPVGTIFSTCNRIAIPAQYMAAVSVTPQQFHQCYSHCLYEAQPQEQQGQSCHAPMEHAKGDY
jgi:hypothetical protein